MATGEWSGEWLREALVDLSRRVKTGLDLDEDVISSLVSFCDRVSPSDAKEYLDGIIGRETGKDVIEEYIRLKSQSDRNNGGDVHPASTFHTHIKPRPPLAGQKTRKPQTAAASASGSGPPAGGGGAPGREIDPDNTRGRGKKKVSLADAAKGCIVFKKGEVCRCQARRHRLVGNCLSCGKIACEQEGEGPCAFCGTLVLRDGTTYSGLDQRLPPRSESEAAAEDFGKRLVGYDRDSAARTAVVDDQSDYYEMEGNRWISAQEKEAFRKREEERREAEKARRRRVVVTFDMFGRKVIVGEGGEEGEKSERSEAEEVKGSSSSNRIRLNPNLQIRPIFVNPEYSSTTGDERGRAMVKWGPDTGLRVHITGRVQHECEGMAPAAAPHT